MTAFQGVSARESGRYASGQAMTTVNRSESKVDFRPTDPTARQVMYRDFYVATAVTAQEHTQHTALVIRSHVN
jgi:hypothetical protein